MQHSDALAAGTEALRRFLVGDDDLDAMLKNVTTLATEAVDGADLGSITLLREGMPMTPVFSHQDALRLDEAQYHQGAGPCLEAIRSHQVVRAATADELGGRWPEFAATADRLGVTGTMSIPLASDAAALGGLNLYSRTTATFDEAAVDTGCRFADQIGVAAANVYVYAEGYELAQHLRVAMESRAVIEQAKGILMAAERCTANDAFDILRRASQAQNRKLREIATEIVERYQES